MTWEKLNPIKGEHGECLNCGVRSDTFKMDDIISVGFGYAAVHRDGECLWSEGENKRYVSGSDAEKLAINDPDHDWRIILHGPLSGREYQRHGECLWVLIYQDMGFA